MTMLRSFLLASALILTPAVLSAQGSLPRSTPEAEGIASAGIAAFIEAVDASELEVHSFMLLRNGNVVAEGWWEPYGADRKHIMFSVSKTVTALGVGIAADEGRLSLDDRVVSFFPEVVTDSVSPETRQLTVRHLLTMSVGQEQEAGRSDAGWVHAFLHNPPVYEPGTRFMYNNMASFVLSAIVQKATGERLFHYLQPRLFEPLGLQNISWDINPEGYTVGMIGARLHTEDLAKLGQLLLQKGQWNGEQLVSAAYVDDLATVHIENHDPETPLEARNDGQRGYGYQVWHGRHNSFRLDGLGGQLSIVLPDYDAVVVLTSNVRTIQDELDLVWEHLIPAFADGRLPADPAAHAHLNERLSTLEIAPVDHTEQHGSADTDGSPRQYTLQENPLGIRTVTFSLDAERCLMTLEGEAETRVLEAGIGHWRLQEWPATSLAAVAPANGFRRDSNGPGPDDTAVVAASCGLQEDGTLQLTSRFVEDNIGAETWRVLFGGEGETVEITTGASRWGGEPTVLRGGMTH